MPRPPRSQAAWERCVGDEWPVLAGFGRFFAGLTGQHVGVEADGRSIPNRQSPGPYVCGVRLD